MTFAAIVAAAVVASASPANAAGASLETPVTNEVETLTRRGGCVLAPDATAAEMVASCRTMLPRDASLSGRLILRNRRGTVIMDHAYALERRGGKTFLFVDGAEVVGDEGPIMGTDVTWSDITLDYLWWDDVSFDEEREGETVHGQKCSVLALKKGARLVRAWVDRKTGAMMQAEELSGGKAVRRLWGTRIKKFGDRWAPNVMEVETLGSGHRTKITVEKLEVKEQDESSQENS